MASEARSPLPEESTALENSKETIVSSIVVRFLEESPSELRSSRRRR